MTSDGQYSATYRASSYRISEPCAESTCISHIQSLLNLHQLSSIRFLYTLFVPYACPRSAKQSDPSRPLSASTNRRQQLPLTQTSATDNHSRRIESVEIDYFGKTRCNTNPVGSFCCCCASSSRLLHFYPTSPFLSSRVRQRLALTLVPSLCHRRFQHARLPVRRRQVARALVGARPRALRRQQPHHTLLQRPQQRLCRNSGVERRKCGSRRSRRVPCPRLSRRSCVSLAAPPATRTGRA